MLQHGRVPLFFENIIDFTQKTFAPTFPFGVSQGITQAQPKRDMVHKFIH